MQLTNSEGNPLFVLDRSRLDAAAHCPRQYFWHYAFLGIGIQRLRAMPIWALLTGTYTHNGIESVLHGVAPTVAATQAVTEYAEAIEPVLAALDLGDRREIVMREFAQQLDLVKALVYGWALIGLPRYSALYDVIEIEKEETVSFLVDGTEIRLLTRADIIGQIRNTDMYVISNLKTVSNADQRWREQWQFDQSTLTEPMATEARLGGEVVGVIIEGLCKGNKQEYPKQSGFWQQNSPLIWAWADKVDGQQLPGEGRQFYGRYEWTCTEAHRFSNGRKCPGGKEHRLSGVYKARVEGEYPGGIFAWIDYLAANDRGVLEEQFISLPPIGRSPFEVERWKRQVLPAELARQQNAELVNKLFVDGDKDNGYRLLDHYFPMSTAHGNCLRPSECAYKDICWHAGNPFDETIWGPREINHATEGELIIEAAK